MKGCIKFNGISAALIYFSVISTIQSAAQDVQIDAVIPYIGQNKMEVKIHLQGFGAFIYNGSNAEKSYRRKEGEGAYSDWMPITTQTDYYGSFFDESLSPTPMYTYQCRFIFTFDNGELYTLLSNELKNGLFRVWPVRNSDGVTESLELMHGFGQPYEGGGTKFLHEGIDIHGESEVDNEIVVAPVGGIVRDAGLMDPLKPLTSIAVNIEVSMDGIICYIQLNHLKDIPNALVNGTFVDPQVFPGQTLGKILDPHPEAFWKTMSSHTHCHFWNSIGGNGIPDPLYQNYLFSNAINPFKIWDQDIYRDPQTHNLPKLLDTNGDGKVLLFRKTPVGTDYFSSQTLNKTIVHNGADIIVEAIDEQSSDSPWQVPKVVGYFIEQQVNGNWNAAVKTSARPYILVDNSIYYESNSKDQNFPVVNTIIDFRDELKSKKPSPTPENYIWDQWFAYTVTNTKGEDGAISNLDANQRWATDARNSIIEANGYKAGYELTDIARVIDEAKFPDGNYRVNIRLEDFVHISEDYKEEIVLDNFKPYAKKAEIQSGAMSYEATWNWDKDAGQLFLTTNTNSQPAGGAISIKITFSEPMQLPKVEIPTLNFGLTKQLLPVPGTDNKVWECSIPVEETLIGGPGPHKIIISGIDLAGNDLQGFITKEVKPYFELQKRNLDGSWTSSHFPITDQIHEFMLSTNVSPTINCPSNITVNTESGKCGTLVSFPSTSYTGVPTPILVYKIGATEITSPHSFPVGKTTVTAVASNGVAPDATCSFVVTVEDNEKPVLTCPTVPTLCNNASGTYTLDPLQVIENCSIQSYAYTITGATSRSGMGVNASGKFNPGKSSIEWSVTDINGNKNSCITTVTVNQPLNVSIPDAKALNQGTDPNTVYKGYSPASSITLKAQVSGGTLPYEYSWSNGATSSGIRVNPGTATDYTITIMDGLGCTTAAVKQVKVIDVRCGNKGNKVEICNVPPRNPDKAKSKCLDAGKVPDHLVNGSYLGACKSGIPQFNISDKNGNEEVFELTIKAIPNPSSTFFNISMSSDHLMDKATLRVLDVLGRVLEVRSMSAGTIVRLGSSYHSGIYFVEVTRGKEKVIVKLIKD